MNKTKKSNEINHNDSAEKLAKEIHDFLMRVINGIGLDQSIEKENEVVLHLLFNLYITQLKKKGFFAQDELLDLMRQAEIAILGFSNLDCGNIDFLASDDNELIAVDWDASILTKVYS